MQQARSDADLMLGIRRAADEANSSIPSVVGSRHGRSGHSSRAGHGHHRRSSAESGVSRLSRGSRLSRSAASLSSYTGTRSSSGTGPLCMTLEENQKHVQEAAMDRYVQSLEKEAHEAVADKAVWRTAVQAGFDEETNEKLRRRRMEQEHQALLKDQMESNKARRAEKRREYIHAASSHSFPLFTETFIDLEEYERIRKEQKVLFRKELDEQMTMNTMLRNVEEKKHHDMALKKQKENFASMARDRNKEYQRLADQGRELVASWERDIRLKSLKRAMQSGHDVTREVTMNRGGDGR